MESRSHNSRNLFFHSTTFVTSGGRKTGNSKKVFWDVSPAEVAKRKHSEVCPFPTPRASKSWKMPIDSNLPCHSPPSVIHLPLPLGGIENSFFGQTESSPNSEGLSELSTLSIMPSVTKEPGTPKPASLRLAKLPTLSHFSEKKLDKMMNGFISEPRKTTKRPTPQALKAHKEFLYYLFESICLRKVILPSISTFPTKRCISLERPSSLQSNKTLVLDLDETLVHGVQYGEGEANLIIDMGDGEAFYTGVSIRPRLRNFLNKINKIYEVIVFTSSHKAYAEAIIDFIEGGNKLVHHRLYREQCVEVREDLYIKDLRILNRDLENMLIVDNSPYAFAAQLENGYPIIPFYDDPEDSELEVLEKYLIEIQNTRDIRIENRKKFRLKEIAEYNIEDYAKYYKEQEEDEYKDKLVEAEFEGLKESLNHFFDPYN